MDEYSCHFNVHRDNDIKERSYGRVRQAMEVEYYTEQDPTIGTVKCIVGSHVLNMYHEVWELDKLITNEGQFNRERFKRRWV